MDLVIKEEFYKVKVGAEVYSVRFPTLDEMGSIEETMTKAQADGGGKKNVDQMKKWLGVLGLDAKFYSLKGVNAKHILTIWEGVNTIKK